MGAYIPGMEEHNAVNNDDGFTTGFIGNHGGSSVNLVPPQGYMQDPVEPPMGNTQQMPQMQNTQQMPPMGNTQQMPQMQNTQQMPPVSNQPMPQPEMNAMPQQEMKEEKKSDFRITDPSVIGKKTGADLFEAKK